MGRRSKHVGQLSFAHDAACFVALATVIFALVGLVAWLGRESLLRKAADLWIVSDTLTRADAIVVLGGNSRTRPQEAADLYRKGLAKKVLVSRTGRLDQSATGIGPSDWELNRAALLKLGVSASAIETFGKANATTREEAIALREWTEQNAASVFIIPTEIFSARRVQWIFRREFFGRAVIIEVTPVEPPEYTREEWWKTELGLATFQNELLKYTYYRWNY